MIREIYLSQSIVQWCVTVTHQWRMQGPALDVSVGVFLTIHSLQVFLLNQDVYTLLQTDDTACTSKLQHATWYGLLDKYTNVSNCGK